MSGDIAIRIRSLGKKYTIGGPQERYLTFRDTLVNSVKAPFRRLTQKEANQSANEFWALKDVSFDVHKGEIVGIIGRNGAGKSTLLKILSRITTPTEGEVDIYGRVGSLLEVGTGFHPELTGSENIFLSGSLLGMRKREIEEKFDEIVKFSEIEKFIDTPVKRYSSGMYVRLAFAVAAHLETEILIVDEVLAVGDSQFQKKCMGKMGNVAKQGRTVLFVSHNMGAVSQLCKTCLWIDQGKIKSRGQNVEIIKDYLSFGQSGVYGEITSDMNFHQPLELRFERIQLLDQNGKPTKSLFFGSSLNIQFDFEVYQLVKAVRLGVTIQTFDGILIYASHQTDDPNQTTLKFQPGKYSANVILNNRLMPGDYTIGLIAKPYPGHKNSGERSMAYVERGFAFHIENLSIDGKLVLPTRSLIYSDSEWQIESLN